MTARRVTLRSNIGIERRTSARHVSELSSRWRYGLSHPADLYLYLVRLVFYLLFELPAVGAELRGERERLCASALYRGLVELAFDGAARAGLDAHVVHQ